MPDLTCPTCGTESHFDQMRRDASEFCRVCDYPLFWVRTTAFGSDNGDGDDGNSLRRLPGTAGRVLTAQLLCPNCTEPNQVTAHICIRCGADLHPKPVVIAPPPPAPEPMPEPVVVPPPKANPWPWVLLGVAIVLLVVSLIALAVV